MLCSWGIRTLRHRCVRQNLMTGLASRGFVNNRVESLQLRLPSLNWRRPSVVIAAGFGFGISYIAASPFAQCESAPPLSSFEVGDSSSVSIVPLAALTDSNVVSKTATDDNDSSNNHHHWILLWLYRWWTRNPFIIMLRNSSWQSLKRGVLYMLSFAVDSLTCYSVQVLFQCALAVSHSPQFGEKLFGIFPISEKSFIQIGCYLIDVIYPVYMDSQTKGTYGKRLFGICILDNGNTTNNNFNYPSVTQILLRQYRRWMGPVLIELIIIPLVGGDGNGSNLILAALCTSVGLSIVDIGLLLSVAKTTGDFVAKTKIEIKEYE